MLVSYLTWHYGAGLEEAGRKSWQTAAGFFNYFSIGALLLTLFSPWHRDLQGYGRGFDPGTMLYALAENLVSRIIGAMLRIVVIVAGVITSFFAVLGAILFYLGWLVSPFATVIFIVMGFLMLL